MSVAIPLEPLDDDSREKLVKDLSVKLQIGYDMPSFKIVEVYDVTSQNVHVPLAYALSKRPVTSGDRHFKSINTPFIGTLRPEQLKVKDEAIATLNKQKTCIISCYPGFGKTRTAIYLASKIKLQTLIIINLLVLKQQWIDAITELCPSATISFIEPNPKTKKGIANFDADFLIVNAINGPKFGRDAFKSVGLVIADELHLITSEVLSQTFFYTTPRYLLGLSATPYRQDGMDAVINLFFGEARITRKLFRPHTVHKIQTEYTPEIEYDRNGRMCWNSVIDFQSTNEARNLQIVDIIKTHSTRNFLVLTKRVEQARFLYSQLVEQGEHAALYVESSTSFDKEARVLIGTIKKLGTGFDHTKLDTLIAACDLEAYFIQYLGRIFRSPDGIEPLVFDIVDNNKTLAKHYKTREKVYLDAGGKIIITGKKKLLKVKTEVEVARSTILKRQR